MEASADRAGEDMENVSAATTAGRKTRLVCIRLDSWRT
jgi:hypothetical protein